MAKAGRLLLCLFSLALLASHCLASSWSPCSKKKYPVTIENVVVKPDPVISGKDATFIVPASTDKALDSGNVIITVYFLGFAIHSEKFDLCSKTTCPVAPGNFTIESSQGLPSLTPPGTYQISLEITDTANAKLACAKIKFQIVWWGSSENGMLSSQ